MPDLRGVKSNAILVLLLGNEHRHPHYRRYSPVLGGAMTSNYSFRSFLPAEDLFSFDRGTSEIRWLS